MLRAVVRRLDLRFREPAITSRAVMTEKETYLLKLYDADNPEVCGVGEIPIFRGLSAEDTPGFGSVLESLESGFHKGYFPEVSSVRFGVESALMDLELKQKPFETPFSFRINGLIWMGDKSTMAERIRQKLDAGFKCVKLKIGGISFEDEVDLLRFIRSRFGSAELELRLDANGAFAPEDALKKLDILSRFDIHSIEQPIRAEQIAEMSRIVASSPIPVALDEELIGFNDDEFKKTLLSEIKPHYIILKPSLCGGFAEAEKWISLAVDSGIGWWATSALESNVGLTAIARWLHKLDPVMPQGLGTGGLYVNNLPSPLNLVGDMLVYDPEKEVRWNF